MRGAVPQSLGVAGVAWRLVVTVSVVVTVCLGTWVGNDDWWPFAPMSQYAFTVSNDGVINSLAIDALTVEGETIRVPLSKEAVGIERAEIEGQLPRIMEHPELLQDVAVLHSRRQPGHAAYQALFLRNTSTQIGTGHRTTRTLATWEVVDPLDPQPSGLPGGRRR